MNRIESKLFLASRSATSLTIICVLDLNAVVCCRLRVYRLAACSRSIGNTGRPVFRGGGGGLNPPKPPRQIEHWLSLNELRCFRWSVFQYEAYWDPPIVLSGDLWPVITPAGPPSSSPPRSAHSGHIDSARGRGVTPKGRSWIYCDTKEALIGGVLIDVLRLNAPAACSARRRRLVRVTSYIDGRTRRAALPLLTDWLQHLSTYRPRTGETISRLLCCLLPRRRIESAFDSELDLLLLQLITVLLSSLLVSLAYTWYVAMSANFGGRKFAKLLCTRIFVDDYFHAVTICSRYVLSLMHG